MLVPSHHSVEDFVLKLDKPIKLKAYKLVERLEKLGKNLSMPDAKPIGHGLWELRTKGSPAVRILYGFCGSVPVLLVAFKKQANAIRIEDIKLAQERLKVFCANLLE